MRAEEEMPAYLLETVLRESPRTYQQFETTRRIIACMWTLHDQSKQRPHPTCHHVARLVHAIEPSLTVVDGYFHRGFEHSWLTGASNKYVIDPYPAMTINGPLLVDVSTLAPSAGDYDSTHTPRAILRPTFEEEVLDLLQWYKRASAFIPLP